MGFLRNTGLVIVSVVLFICLLLTGIFATLNLSLTYENVQPRIYYVAEEIIEEQIGAENIVNALLPYVDVYCLTNTEIVQTFGDYTFVFPCDVVSQGYESILNYSVDYIVGDFYYKDYDCSFTECFEESSVPFFLISAHAKEFWRGLFFKFLLASIVLTGLIVLLVQKKSNAPLLAGSLLVGSSLIILSLRKIGITIGRAVLSPISLALSEESTNSVLSNVIAVFFSEYSKVFLWMFVAGLILIAGAIVFKLTGFGFKINKKIENVQEQKNKVSKEDVKKIVKQEINKNKAKKKV